MMMTSAIKLNHMSSEHYDINLKVYYSEVQKENIPFHKWYDFMLGKVNELKKTRRKWNWVLNCVYCLMKRKTILESPEILKEVRDRLGVSQ
jgi:hypothetical protein